MPPQHKNSKNNLSKIHLDKPKSKAKMTLNNPTLVEPDKQISMMAPVSMPTRHAYVVGDLQGSYQALLALKDAINFDEQQDKLWFAGDLVARGENSLATLREVKRLCEAGAAATVLGNHDLTLISVWRGASTPRKKDLTLPIFAAPDCDVLLNWLRKQSLLLYPDAQSVLTHAGIPPNWTLAEAERLAEEVHHLLAGSLERLDAFLPFLYGNEPNVWHHDLRGAARVRCIINYFTRMRLCTAQGVLEFSFKDSLNEPMPAGFRPWFEWPTVEPRTRRMYFGHWAALEGQPLTPEVCATDGGCVWGGELCAYRLSDGQVFKVKTGCGLTLHNDDNSQ